MDPPAIKNVLQDILNSKNPSLEFPQPVLEIMNACIVFRDNPGHQLNDNTVTTTTTTPTETQMESAAQLRLADSAHWMHALMGDKSLHDLVARNKLRKGHIVRLTNYEIIMQPRMTRATGGEGVRSSIPPNKRRRRSPVGDGFRVVRPTFGREETELPCLVIGGLVILSPGGEEEKGNGEDEDEEVKKEMVESEVKIPIVPPPAMVLNPLPQQAVSGVLSPSQFLSQERTSNSRDPDLTPSSATDHVPKIPDISRNSTIS